MADLTDEQVALHDRQRELGPAGQRDLAALFAQTYPRQGIVLDAGGGTGVAVPALRAAGLRPVLLDLDPAMLAASRRHRVLAARADLRTLPIGDETLDGVHAAYVLPTIAEWTQVAGEFVRALRSGAAALISFGAPPADPVVAELSRRHSSALTRAGAVRVGVPAQVTGMHSVEDAQRALQGIGLRPAGEHAIAGIQVRSARNLVHQWSRNPFAVSATPEVIAAAEAETLAWAAATLGDVDHPREIRVRHILHRFTRTP